VTETLYYVSPQPGAHVLSKKKVRTWEKEKEKRKYKDGGREKGINIGMKRKE
jgi:hypothetical protein